MRRLNAYLTAYISAIGDKSRDRDRKAADRLRLQHAKSAAIKSPVTTVLVSAPAGGRAILARRKESQRQRAPDSRNQ